MKHKIIFIALIVIVFVFGMAVEKYLNETNISVNQNKNVNKTENNWLDTESVCNLFVGDKSCSPRPHINDVVCRQKCRDTSYLSPNFVPQLSYIKEEFIRDRGQSLNLNYCDCASGSEIDCISAPYRCSYASSSSFTNLTFDQGICYTYTKYILNTGIDRIGYNEITIKDILKPEYIDNATITGNRAVIPILFSPGDQRPTTTIEVNGSTVTIIYKTTCP